RADGQVDVGRHARMFAAAGMLLATGQPHFRADFEESFEELLYDPSYHHLNGFAAQLYLKAAAGDPERKRKLLERMRGLAAWARQDGDKHPFEWATRYHWGSVGAGFTRSGSYNVKACLADPAANAADCDQALANVHYALGRNSLHLSYVSGLPGVARGHIWAFHHWLATLRATARVTFEDSEATRTINPETSIARKVGTRQQCPANGIPVTTTTSYLSLST